MSMSDTHLIIVQSSVPCGSNIFITITNVQLTFHDHGPDHKSDFRITIIISIARKRTFAIMITENHDKTLFFARQPEKLSTVR